MERKLLKVVQTLHIWDQIVYEVDNFFIDPQFNEIFVCRISVLDLVIDTGNRV